MSNPTHIRVVEPVVIDRDGHEISGTGESAHRSPFGAHASVNGKAVSLSWGWAVALGILLPVMAVAGFAFIGVVLATLLVVWLVRSVIRTVLG